MKPDLKTIVLIAGCLLLGFLLNSQFQCGHSKTFLPEYLDQLKAERDTARAETKRVREEKDREIEQYRVRDSILATAYQKNQLNYKPIYESLKNIPVNYSRISNDDAAILREFSKRE